MQENEVQTPDAAQSPQYLDGTLLSKMAHGGAAVLKNKAEEVNRLNVFPVPDGDTGVNMYRTIESGVAAFDRMDSDNLSEVMQALSHGMLLGARGNSGVILSQFFSGMAKGFENKEKADCRTIGTALETAVRQAYRAVLTPTEGTILTVAREAVEYAVSRITDESTITSLFADLTEEMYASLQRTPEFLAVLKEAGVIDSGGAGLLYIMQGFNRVLRGEQIKLSADDAVGVSQTPARAAVFDSESEMTYGYCTELLLQLQSRKTDLATFDLKTVTDFLASVGDSVVAVVDGTILKIHVHTMTPERVLEFCHAFGEFITLKIENMSLQHNETLVGKADKNPAKAQPRKRYGSIAVCSGAGIEATFREFGVDEIVAGGQTSNPSTGDFLRAFDKVAAEHIFVFPNNGNIYLAAKQAASIYRAADVHVIESKDLGSGYVGITAIDPDAESADDVEKEIVRAMRRVTTGCVSTAIRDANLNGVQIANGDYIAFVGKETVAADRDVVTVAKALADRLLADKRKSMLTVFCGVDAAAADQSALQEWLHKTYPRVEVYFSDGGQEIYPYIFIAE